MKCQRGAVMASRHPIELRGFDSYELKLGDELRGERASKGKSLLDVQRDLRIKASYIAAIEDSDPSAFPNDGFAAGYIRSYARYLGLDPDDVYRRFCEEAKIESFSQKTSVEPTLGAAPKPVSPGRKIEDIEFSTRFAPSNARAERMDLAAGLRGLLSVAVLAALVGGLGFGGWTVLQNFQRVGFAPLPEAPEVLATAPAAPTATHVAAEADEGARVTLAALYAEQELAPPALAPRDGPISSIDPAHAGVFAPPARAAAPVEVVTDGPAAHMAQRGGYDGERPFAVGETPAAAEAQEAAMRAAALEQAEEPQTGRVAVWARAEAWVRVTDGAGKVLFTGILAAGDHFPLPADVEAPALRAGNAGSVYLAVGEALFGPLGDGPVVAKNVSLTPEAIRAAFAPAGLAAPSEEARTDSGDSVAQLPQE